MKSDVNYWENVITAEKKIEPQSKEEQADFEIAEYLVQKGKEAAA